MGTDGQGIGANDELMKRFAEALKENTDSRAAFREVLFAGARDRIVHHRLYGYVAPWSSGIYAAARYRQAPVKHHQTVASGNSSAEQEPLAPAPEMQQSVTLAPLPESKPVAPGLNDLPAAESDFLATAPEQLEEEAQWILSAGLKGIKMHPDSQRFNIDDERLFPVYELLQDKIPVMLHMGDPRYPYSHPARLRRVLDLFPRLQVIAAHFGGYGMYETAYECLRDKDCIFDVSSSMMFMENGTAEKFINIYGAERMAFGTDYPMWDPVDEVQSFLKLRLTGDQFEQIAHKTAERILGI